MLYVQLDTNWPDNEKIMDAGMDGAGLHAITMCLVARSERGTVPRSRLLDCGATDALIDRLIRLRLIHDVGDDEITVHSVHIGGLTRRRWIPSNVRREVMARDGHRCVTCAAADDLSLDHIVPHSHDGAETVENLRVLCRPCNSRRGNRV